MVRMVPSAAHDEILLPRCLHSNCCLLLRLRTKLRFVGPRRCSDSCLVFEFSWRSVCCAGAYVLRVVWELVVGSVPQLEVFCYHWQIEIRKREPRHIVLVFHVGV